MDYIVLVVRFAVIYGGCWFVLSRHLSNEGIFEKTVFTIIIVHLCAYFTFLVHYISGLFYTPISSILVFGCSLCLIRYLVSSIDASSSDKGKHVHDSNADIIIWSICIIYFLVLYFTCSYRFAAGGAAYHGLLDLWKFNRDTLAVYPDLHNIGYSLLNMPLFHHPLFYTNALLLNSGISNIDHAISGFALIHFISVMGMMLFIYLLLKELTGSTLLSFACLILYATWRPNGGYSFLFMPDYNSFVGFFSLGCFYFLVKIWKCFSVKELWLLLLCIILGVNNRIWLAGLFLGLLLPFAWMLLKKTWLQRSNFYNSKIIILFGLTLFVGAYWSFAVYGIGAKGGASSLYQASLLTELKAQALSLLQIFSNFSEIASVAAKNVYKYYFEIYFSNIGQSFLPGYISVMGVLGLFIFCWRYRREKPVWKIVGAILLALYITAFITPPGYPRSYLWLMSFLMLFATLFVNEVYRSIPFSLQKAKKIAIVLGLVVGIYLNYSGILYATGIEKSILNRWKFSPTPGTYAFYQDVNTLVYLRADIQRVAKQVNPYWQKESKILHLIIEPGSDLDTFINGTYWWENYYFFPGDRGNDLMENIFTGYRNNDIRFSPCRLLDHNISLIDVPVNFDDLIKYRKWTTQQVKIIEMMRQWLEDYPDVFKIIAQGHAGRKVYSINAEAVCKAFNCSKGKNKVEVDKRSVLATF